MELTPQQQKKIEGICKKVKEYMDLRFAHAVRINPKISHVYDDMSWQQLESLKDVISSGKAFGPVKYLVADILTGDDESKRKALFSPTDQNSIMNEILNIKDKDDKKKTAGILGIKDMRSFYQALDPSLEKILELMQTWIWWDLGDACDIFHFELQVNRIIALRDNELTDNIVEYYRKIHKKAAEEINKEFILAIEMEKLKHLLDRFAACREADEGYQLILKRDEQPNNAIDIMIVNLTKRITAFEKVKTSNILDAALKDFYAKLYNIPPSEISKEKIIEMEDKAIGDLKNQLASSIKDGKVLGPPYDYKVHQMKSIHDQFIKLEKSMPFLQKELEHLHEMEKEEKEAQKRAASSFY